MRPVHPPRLNQAQLERIDAIRAGNADAFIGVDGYAPRPTHTIAMHPKVGMIIRLMDAQWMIDVIGAWQPEEPSDFDETVQRWQLSVDEDTGAAKLTCENPQAERLFTLDIAFTDFGTRGYLVYCHRRMILQERPAGTRWWKTRQ